MRRPKRERKNISLITGLKPMNKKQERIIIFFILLFFGLIYSSISLVNHYQFRTSALDLGFNTHALHCYAHLINPRFMAKPEINYLGNHFTPVIILFIPLYYLFGSYTLLIIQILSVLGGGLGIYFYTRLKTKYTYLPFIILFQFYSIWGIYSALAFDFHFVVIAAMLVPWFIYFFETENKKLTLVFLALILMCKENVALWMVFIIIGLFAKDSFRKVKTQPFYSLSLLMVAGLYFLLIIGIIMPALNKGAVPIYFRNYYSHIGQSFSETVVNLITHPKNTFKLFFSNIYSDKPYNGIKSELYLVVLVSGGLALLFKPNYLIMLIPVFAQKMLSKDPLLWGTLYHYSIEFAPIISIALFDWTNSFNNRKIGYSIAILFMLLTSLSSMRLMDHRKSIWFNPVNMQFYSKKHYDRSLNFKEIYGALKLIPDYASVSAHHVIAPHIANREKLYQFPIIKDAEYIVLFQNKRGSYPMKKKDYADQIEQYKNSEEIEVVYDDNDLLIFRILNPSSFQ
jgi:uncharacterized membrane protein